MNKRNISERQDTNTRTSKPAIAGSEAETDGRDESAPIAPDAVPDAVPNAVIEAVMKFFTAFKVTPLFASAFALAFALVGPALRRAASARRVRLALRESLKAFA